MKANDTMSGRCDSYFDTQVNKMKWDKELVAKHVAEDENLVHDGDAIVLDAGSSATCVGQALFASKKRNLSIITHNMDVFKKYGPMLGNVSMSCGNGSSNMTVSGQHQLLLAGGCFDPSYNALYGHLTERAYEEFHPNVVILAVSGLTASAAPGMQSGVYCHAVVETRVKESLFNIHVDRRIIVADYKKIGRVDSHMFGDLSRIGASLSYSGKSYLITTEPPDNSPDDKQRVFLEAVSTLRDWGVEVVCVNKGRKE